jgi:hypothetical protein
VTGWARAVTAVAAVRVIAGLALYLSGQTTLTRPPPLPLEAYALLAATFGLLGVSLLAANRHDVRASWLGGVFVLVSAPLCSPFFRTGIPEGASWFLAVRPDAFLAAFLWKFLIVFPTPLSGRAARVAEHTARVAVYSAFGLAIVNLSFFIVPGPDWRDLVRPTAESGSLYYPIVFGLSAAAFGMLLWRAVHARADDRGRIRLFVGGLAAGLVPFAVQGMLDAIPAYNAFVHQPGVELVVGLLLFGALGAVPVITAYSVLFDRVVELRIVLRAALQYALARYTIIVVAVVPFVALALLMIRHRQEPLVALFSGPRPVALGATALAGIITLRMRQLLIAQLDRRFFREAYDPQRTLDALVSGAVRARDTSEIEAVWRDVAARNLHADASLFVGAGMTGEFRRPNGTGAIDSGGLLSRLACADLRPMDVDPGDDRSPFRRLSPEEQHWILSSRVHLLIGMRAADGRPLGLLAIGSKRSGLPFTDEDRRLLAAAGGSVALALDNLRLRATPEPAPEPAAMECIACFRLHPPDLAACTCGGTLKPALAPLVLRGTFQLDRRIGAGGMGIVYHAWDLHLERSVAIKTLPRVSTSDAARLRREARAMAAVIDPHLAVIHGLETWNGIPLLIQEFLPGGTLADRLQRGPLAIAETLALGVTLAGVLRHLHDAGIVHRDIKPSNIGFTQTGLVKLLDFGLARLVDPTPVQTTETLRDGSSPSSLSDHRLVGTPPYMAPEALLGHSPRPAFDLWSLAVVLYESLTGRRPFDVQKGNRLLAIAAPAVPPSALDPACSPAIDAFFDAALSVDSSRRPASAAMLEAQLVQLRDSAR